ncbi:hypothetical protein EDB85DRAFT_2007206, partial [Lactarius pseudohatsudake]
MVRDLGLHAAGLVSWLGARVVACIVEPQVATLSSKWGLAYSSCVTVVGGARSVVVVLHLNVFRCALRWSKGHTQL